MKKLNSIAAALFTVLTLLVLLPAASLAAFVSGSTGADGDFTPIVNTVLQIPASGIFNFGTVTIPSGVTVTFTKNSQNTPVTILATGDVTISGAVIVDGTSASNNLPGTGGPGGFDGGYGGNPYVLGYRGQGPGGGSGGLTMGLAGSGGGGGFSAGGSAGNLCATYYNGSGGQYCQGSGSGAGGAAYGNAGLIPLIGGSGGGGGAGVNNTSGAGGGGGGAILIASSGTIRVNGSITANGGNGTYAGGYNGSSGGSNATFNAGGAGSGGALRLVANVITGEGTISAVGGSSQYYSTYSNGYYPYTYTGGTGSVGRIRMETWQFTRVGNTSPSYSIFTYPATLYPPTIPSLAITQVNGQNVPATPTGAFRTPDVSIPFNTPSPITVTVSALNIPVAGKTVTVRAMPESGNTIITATGTLAGTDSASSVQVSLPISSAVAYVLSASVNY